ncbi:hypothetical protein [Cryobacterium sp. PH31-O1]|uniref:hypothetical protein n=1 Tax=Cryobacterium sp. PH31-O1 TaxID=3046306 RepID=UPI0024BA01F8|nr:hypothetical protein [Cryobacterium sp. PH31-O1]MDJ0336924.1 hypothetical protein [Cryobacterium sp. PH31-O1]
MLLALESVGRVVDGARVLSTTDVLRLSEYFDASAAKSAAARATAGQSVAAQTAAGAAVVLAAPTLARRLGCRSGVELVCTLARVSRAQVRQRAALGAETGQRMLLGRPLTPIYPVLGDALQNGAVPGTTTNEESAASENPAEAVAEKPTEAEAEVEAETEAEAEAEESVQPDGLGPCPQQPDDTRSISEKRAGILRAVFEPAARQPDTPTPPPWAEPPPPYSYTSTSTTSSPAAAPAGSTASTDPSPPTTEQPNWNK